MVRKNIAFTLCAAMVFVLLSACNVSAPQTSPEKVALSLETLPAGKEFSLLAIEKKQEIYSFLYDISHDELVDYMEQAYRKSAESQTEFSFHSIDVFDDPLLVSHKKKEYNTLFVTVEFSAKFDRDMPFSEMEVLTERWYEERVANVSRYDIAVYLRLKEIKIRFKDLDTKRYIDIDLSPSFSYPSEEERPQIPGQSQEEQQTIVAISDYLEGLSEEERQFTLKRFGISEIGTDSKDELYVEVSIAYPGIKTSLQEFADKLLAEVKSNDNAQTYIQDNSLTKATIVLNTPDGLNKYETFNYVMGT